MVHPKASYFSFVSNMSSGTGFFFNFEVHDGRTDMKVTAFMEQCTKFFGVVEEDATLFISGGKPIVDISSFLMILSP